MDTMKLHVIPITFVIILLKSDLSVANGGSEWYNNNHNNIHIQGGASSPPHSSYASAAAPHQETDIHRQQQGMTSRGGKDRYSSLPHTVFSPQGRLYNVETAAQLSSDESDTSSSLVFAFQFGRADNSKSDSDGDGDSNGSILILSAGPTSPYLHVGELEEGANKKLCKEENVRGRGREDGDDKSQNENSKTSSSLWQHDLFLHSDENKITATAKIIPSMPISILSPNIIVGTGGNAVDTIVLHTKILEIFLSLSKSYNGMNSTHRIKGTVVSPLLARKIADSLQVPTQNVSANSGRILSVSSPHTLWCMAILFSFY